MAKTGARRAVRRHCRSNDALRRSRPCGTHSAGAFLVLFGVSTVVALLFKLSQTAGHYSYSPASAQGTAEAIKLALSLGFLWREHARDAAAAPLLPYFRAQLSAGLLAHLAGLSALYFVNNQAAFLLFKLSDVSTNVLFKSGASGVSALLLWAFLSRPIAGLQWLAIALQVCGLLIVQYDECTHAAQLPATVYLLLLGSLVVTCVCNVWNEHLLKAHAAASLNLQNAVLYASGLVLNLGLCAATSGLGRYFGGYTPVVLGLILCQARTDGRTDGLTGWRADLRADSRRTAAGPGPRPPDPAPRALARNCARRRRRFWASLSQPCSSTPTRWCAPPPARAPPGCCTSSRSPCLARRFPSTRCWAASSSLSPPMCT